MLVMPNHYGAKDYHWSERTFSKKKNVTIITWSEETLKYISGGDSIGLYRIRAQIYWMSPIA